MSLLAQDSSVRYRVRPRTRRPDEKPQQWLTSAPPATLPTAKVPEKVAVPIPVPMPMAPETSPTGDTGRYKVKPPGVDLAHPSRFPRQATPDFFGPAPEMPQGDTNAPPEMPASPIEPVPPGQQALRAAVDNLEAEKNTPVKKDKWWKSILKMLAHGAKDMPPARDWGEFAYGAGRTGGAGIAGAVKHDLPGQIQKRYRVGELEREVDRAQKTANIESTIQSRADMTKTRNARLNRDLTKDEVQAEQRGRTNIANDLKRLPYIDPSNPVHAKLLARAKASGIDIDPESFGKGKNRPRIRVLDDDGVTVHWFEKDPARGWVPVNIEGKNAVAAMTDKRNPLTGETYSSAERRDFARERFDWQKVEAAIDNRRAERALALQQQGMNQKVASAQAEVEAIDDALPGLESSYLKYSTGEDADEILATQIQRTLTTLKERRGRASGVAGAPSAGASKYSEADVRARAKASGKNEDEAVRAARAAKLIP